MESYTPGSDSTEQSPDVPPRVATRATRPAHREPRDLTDALMDHNNWLGMRVALPFHVPGGYEAKVWRLEACFFSGPKFEYPFYYYIPLPEDREETLQILADIAHNRGYAPGEIAKEIHDRRERDAAGR